MQSEKIANEVGEVRDLLDIVEKRHSRVDPPDNLEKDQARISAAIGRLSELEADL